MVHLERDSRGEIPQVFDEMRSEEYGWDSDSERNGIEKRRLCGWFSDSPLCIGNCELRGQEEDVRNGYRQCRRLPFHILRVGRSYGNFMLLYIILNFLLSIQTRTMIRDE